jgi:cell division protein FtsB
MRFIRIFSPGRILLVGTLVVVAYLSMSAGTNLLHSYHLASDESQLREQVAGLQQKQDELRQIRDYLQSDDYVEFMARRIFGLVKPGETLVEVDALPPAPPPESPANAEWWERLFGR